MRRCLLNLECHWRDTPGYDLGVGRKTKFALGFVAVVVAAIAALLAFVAYHRVGPAKVPVERETTYLTEPLDALGRVDYLAYLNQEPLPPAEENAALVLLEIFGTQALVGDVADTLEALGSPRGLTLKGTLQPESWEVPDFHAFDALDDELSPDELQAARRWIEANAKALARLPAAAACPHLAMPVAYDPESGLLSFGLHVSSLQELNVVLASRVTLATHEGRVRDAWRDVQLWIDLSRLYAQTPHMITRLVADGTRHSVLDWVQYAAGRGVLNDDLLGEIRGVLETLPPLPGLDSAVIERERLCVLAAYTHQVARGIRADGGDPHWDPLNVELVAALRAVNTRFDEFEVLLREDLSETIRDLHAAADRAEERVKSLKRDVESFAGKVELGVRRFTGGGAEPGRLTGEVLASMVLTLFPWVAQKSMDAAAERDFTLLALAVRAHQRRTGSFPATLDALAKVGQPAPWGSLKRDLLEYEIVEDGVSLAHGDSHLDFGAGTR